MATAAAAAIIFDPARGLRAIPRRIRVLTVDGHPLVHDGLAATINGEEDMTVVATASSGEEAIGDVRRYRPDVVTIDLLLPDMPGEDLARRILAEFPRTRIVAITSAQGHLHAQRALDAGVHGYLSKTAPGRELVRAIRQVKAGGRMIPGPVPVQVTARREPGLAESLGALWCRLMHETPMWPIHGAYRCRNCGRSYPVPWTAA